MSTLDLSKVELVKLVTKLVIEALLAKEVSIPIGISNRHVHLNREDMDILFGKDYELRKLRSLRQPGHFAAEEVVTLKGPRGQFNRVRILGPLRENTQVEISLSDSHILGVEQPVRESGKHNNTPGLEIIGPKGKVVKDCGTIIALRHIHLDSKSAEALGVKDGDYVSVELSGDRGAVFKNVLLRVSDSYVPEIHIDLDEANAVKAVNGQKVTLVK